MARKRVLVFRLDLFKGSEPFIVDQAAAHRDWEPTFVGAELMGKRPNFAETVLLSERDRLHHLVATADVSAVHAHFAIDAAAALPLARRLGIPLITTLHGFDVTRTTRSLVLSGKPNLLRFIAKRRRLKAEGARFLPVSNFLHRMAIQQGYPLERTSVHHIGIPATGASMIRKQPGLVLHVARLVEKKGTVDLIRAFRHVTESHPGAHLKIVGDGPERPRLERLTEELGITQVVEFAGQLSHIETLRAIEAATVFCLPSRTASNGDAEGLGMVLLEAARSNAAIVATNSGGIPDFVEDRVTGLLSSERDISKLIQNLCLALDDGPAIGQMRVAAKHRLTARFDVLKQTVGLETIFDELTSQQGESA